MLKFKKNTHLLLIAFLTLVSYFLYTLYSYTIANSNEFLIDINSNYFDSVRYNQSEVIEINENNEHVSFNYKQTTVVSIYFSLEKSKHSKNDYLNWNRNMLMSVEAPLVIFTDQKSKQFIIDERRRLTTQNQTVSSRNFHTILFVYTDIWHLMSELENKRQKSYTFEYMYQQNRKDPEKRIHNPSLYAVWNLKLFALAKVARMNKFNSKFFIYTDMGGWRNGIMEKWPDEKFIHILSHLLDDRMLFAQISDIRIYNPLDDIIEGTFYAGSQKAIEKFEKEFYDLHDKRLDRGEFIGKDQTLININEFEINKGRNVRLKTWLSTSCEDRRRSSYDAWFFYQFYLAHKKDYECSYEKKLSFLTNL